MYIIDSQSFSNYVYVLFMIAQFPPNSERNVAYTDPDICKRDGGGGGGRGIHLFVKGLGGSLLNAFNDFEF